MVNVPEYSELFYYLMHPVMELLSGILKIYFQLYNITYIWVVLRKGVHTKGGDHVRECITHLLSIQNLNVDDFHVSIAIIYNI